MDDLKDIKDIKEIKDLKDAKNYEDSANRDDNTIICRCSDVTLGEVRRLIKMGYTTLDEIKRITRIGMGPCQGKTCGQLVMREIALATGKDIRELKNQTNRPLIVGARLELMAKEAK